MYVKTQAALRIRAEQNIPFAEAVAKVDEIQSQNNNVALKTNNVTYASKLKTGIKSQTEVRNTSIDIQTTVTDVQIVNSFEKDLFKLMNNSVYG